MNYTQIYYNNKIEKLILKIDNKINHYKFIKQGINILSEIEDNKICNLEVENLEKLSKLIYKKLCKNFIFTVIGKKYTNKFIKYLEYLEENFFYNQCLENIINLNSYSLSLFEETYILRLIKIIGNCRKYKYFLDKKYLNLLDIIRLIDYESYHYLIPLILNSKIHNRTLKYDYILRNFLKNIDKIGNQNEIIYLWLKVIFQLVNNKNKHIFLKYSGFENINKIKKNSLDIEIIRYCSMIFHKTLGLMFNLNNTNSLILLCKEHNTLIPIKYIIENTDINYKQNPLKIALLCNNKQVIDFFISGGIEINQDIKDILYSKLIYYHTFDKIFVNKIQYAFIKRQYNEKIINKVIKSYNFYDHINQIIKIYVDNVHEYVKNEDLILEILKKKKLNDICFC